MGDSGKIKTMCGLGKELQGEARAAFVEAVRKPRFFCARCHRVARKKKNLCKPERLEER